MRAIFVLTLTVFLAQQAQSVERPSVAGIDSGEERVVLTLEQVPPVVMSTAKRAAPDVFFTGAERALKNDFIVYRISGRLFREVYHVHVRDDGTLVRVESDNQDD